MLDRPRDVSFDFYGVELGDPVGVRDRDGRQAQ